MSDDEEAKKAAKRRVTTAKSKFTRKLNVMNAHLKEENAVHETLSMMYSEVNKAFTDLENQNDEYLSYFDSGDEEIQTRNTAIEKAYRERCLAHEELSRRLEKNVNPDELQQSQSTKMRTLNPSVRVKKLEAPKFSGVLREFPTFVNDYRNYMEPEYGEDAYALRSCLSGKAMDSIIGIEDDYGKMWERLYSVFGDPEKVVDSVLKDLKSLNPVRDDDSSGLISMIDVVERCWLDLKRLGLEKEMNTSTMITIIEKLLPRTQRREWILHKQLVASELGGTDKFTALMEYLLREKTAIEYISADVCQSEKKGSVHMTETIQREERKDTNDVTLSSLKYAVEELTKAITSSGFSGRSGSSREKRFKCWFHGCLLYTSPSPRDPKTSRMPSSA